MSHRRLAARRFTIVVLALTSATFTTYACRDTSPTGASGSSAHSAHASAARAAWSPAVAQQVAQLRALTAPFHRIEAAAEAGWDTRITECFSSPEGGMGYHYGNVGLIDGAVDASRPELLLYEPQKNGRMRLVAVEYVVPFDLWTDAEPPRLYDVPFHRNEAFGLWVLHVWHFKSNPAGMFTDWNPTVSCEHAAP